MGGGEKEEKKMALETLFHQLFFKMYYLEAGLSEQGR